MREFMLNVLVGFCVVAAVGLIPVGIAFAALQLVEWYPIMRGILLWLIAACVSIAILWSLGGIFRGKA